MEGFYHLSSSAIYSVGCLSQCMSMSGPNSPHVYHDLTPFCRSYCNPICPDVCAERVRRGGWSFIFVFSALFAIGPETFACRRARYQRKILSCTTGVAGNTKKHHDRPTKTENFKTRLAHCPETGTSQVAVGGSIVQEVGWGVAKMYDIPYFTRLTGSPKQLSCSTLCLHMSAFQAGQHRTTRRATIPPFFSTGIRLLLWLDRLRNLVYDHAIGIAYRIGVLRTWTPTACMHESFQ